MHNIYDCIDTFTSLLDTKYLFVLGRKGVSVTLNISFDKKDCFHLMGLQYLTDRVELRRDRGKVFDEIKERKITAEQVEASEFYGQIADRVDMLPMLEELFDSNDTIFKYNRKSKMFSMIQAEYLMKNMVAGKSVFIFLSRKEEKEYFCRSFFPQDTRDYSKDQATWTLLYKEKIKISTGESFVLYDRLRRE